MNGFMAYLDFEGNRRAVFNDVNDMSHNGIVAPWPVEPVVCVEAGRHDLQVFYMITAPNSKDDIYGYFGDLSLKLVDEQPASAMLLDQSRDMGGIYHDRMPVIKQQSVTLLNLGTDNLQVTGSTGSEHFRAVPGASAAQSQQLPVAIEFTGEALGEYDETLTIQTTAGEFQLPCAATVQQLPYDYKPIVANGEFSFDTSDTWAFTVDADKKEAFSSSFAAVAGVDYLKDFPILHCWLSASFVVPEGYTGILAWDGKNSSEPLLNFMGITQLLDGTTIYIDNQMVGEFAGECECGSADVDEEYLSFRPGRHQVKFDYQKFDRQGTGDDRVTISNLALALDGNVGVEDLKPASSQTVYYDLMGRRVDNPQHGTYIRVSGGKAVKVVK